MLFALSEFTTGQIIQTPQKKSEMQPGKEAQSVLATPVRAKKSESDLLRKQITFSGFMVDVASTNSLSKLLSLRQRADPKRDGENLVNDPVTRRIVGVRLLSVGF